MDTMHRPAAHDPGGSAAHPENPTTAPWADTVGPPPPELSLSKIRQTFRFFTDPFSLVREARSELGDLFTLHLVGLGRWVMLSTPELLEALYQVPESHVASGLIRGRMLGRLVGEQASIAIDGEEYTRRRKITAPLFNGQRVLAHTEIIQRFAEKYLLDWPRGKALSAQPLLDHITLAVACRVLYGDGERPTLQRLIELSEGYLLAMKSPFVQVQPLRLDLGRLTPWGRFLRLQKEYFQALENEIDTRLSGAVEPGQDLMAVLLQHYDGHDPDDRRAVIHELASFLLGGAESTSKPISWALYGLLRHPKTLERLRQELDEVLGDEAIGSQHLRQLPYLRAVVMEGLRWGRSAVFAGPRYTLQPIALGGYTIPAGWTVGQCYGETTRNPIFSHAEQFEPEHFLGQRVMMQHWMPFGGGSRICTGMGLAQVEMAVVLGTAVQRLDFELATTRERFSQDGIFFAPPQGLRLRVLGERSS